MNQPALIAPMQEWHILKEQAAVLVSSGMIPRSIRTPEAAIAIMLKGRELGIPPMHAFSHIHILDGKPTMSAELMLTMILKNVPDAKVEFLEVSDQACRIRASRPTMGTFEFSFTRADATTAQLMGKDNWKKYTRAMLRSRAVSEMARSMFPDALSGISYTPEELGSAVEVTESGEIIVAEEVKVEVDPQEKRFVDTPAAWEWLERKVFDAFYLAEDCRAPIRDVAIGKTVRELNQLAYLAAQGHDTDIQA